MVLLFCFILTVSRYALVRDTLSDLQPPLRQHGEWEVAEGRGLEPHHPAGCFRGYSANNTWKEQYRPLALADVLVLWINRGLQPSVLAICYLSRAFQLSLGEEGRLTEEGERCLPLPTHLQGSQAGRGRGFLSPSGCLLRARHLAKGQARGTNDLVALSPQASLLPSSLHIAQNTPSGGLGAGDGGGLGSQLSCC